MQNFNDFQSHIHFSSFLPGDLCLHITLLSAWKTALAYFPVKAVATAGFVHTLFWIFLVFASPRLPPHPGIFDETPGREEVMSQEISFSKDPRWAESSANTQDGSIPQHTPPVWAASWICLTGSRKKMPHLAKLGSWNQESPGCHLPLLSSLR